MKLHEPTEVSQRLAGAAPSPNANKLQRNACLAFLLVWGLAASLQAATVNAAYNSWWDVPITASSYNASGNTINFTLNCAPPMGPGLTVIHITGLGFIQGTFANLPQGKQVVLSYGGQNYYFIANYYGYQGRDLVLQWANMKPMTWGANTNGQLGNNSTAQGNGPVAVNTAGTLWGKVLIAGSAGGNHSLGLSSDGTVTAWGLNTNGQLGNNSTAPSTVPVAVTTSSGPLSSRTAVAVSAGASHSLALCSDGTVVAWGLNTNGQLGNNSTTQSTVPVAVTNSGVLSGKTVAAVCAGGSHSLCLCSNGTAATWGFNSSGQLGNSSTTQSTVPVAVTTSSGALVGKQVAHVSAGASHSLAYCTDGTLAAWGANSSGQLGDNNCPTPSTVAVTVSTSELSSGVFSGIVSGSSANHTLSVVSLPEIDVSGLGIQKQITYNQTSASDPTLDPDMPYMFGSYVQSGTMAALLSSSTLTPPPGSTGTALYQPGSDGLQLQANFTSKTALDAAFTAGTYFVQIQTSTPNTYNAQLSLGSDNYPATPRITGVTNATWSGGALKVTDYTKDVTITWNNPLGANTWFQIDNSNISSGNSSPSTSFMIAGGSLQNDSVYKGTVQLNNGGLGPAIPGLPGVYGNVSYQKQVQFMILTGSASASSPPFMYLLLKNHILVQTSNAAPVDCQNTLSYSDPAPYSLTVQSPVGGAVAGPGSTSLPLGYHADDGGSDYRYSSGAMTSVSALNALAPNGTYTFPGNIQVGLTGDSYPAVTQILSVNGGTPVWDAQGELALDPTLDNTITWSPVTVPNWATNGHEGVFFESYNDYNFNDIDLEMGVLGDSPDPVTSLTIPKFTLTAGYTYMGNVNYVCAPTVSNLGGSTYAVAGYQTETEFVAVALKPQTLTFGTLAAQQFPGVPFALGATTSSGLPVSYTVISGPATVAGNTVTLTGVGTVTIQASQPGTGVYASAANVTQGFTVTYASLLAGFRAANGLAADGSQDLLVPGRDGVPNLLKFAFNMIGAGQGQAATLSVPNVQTVGVSGTAGLPKLGVNGSGKLTLTYIRRKASTTPGIACAVEFSNNLDAGSWAVNGAATESVTSIDSNFERVTVTDSLTTPKRFARVRISEL